MIDQKELHAYSKDLDVLYVEDDRTLHVETLEIFEDYFKKVDSAYDGKEGLEKYDKYFNKTGNYYDIVISDINMPKLNGIEMAKAIKNINPHQEIIVVSAYNDSDKLMKLIDLGINYFLLKPISFEKTLDTLYKVSQSVANKKASVDYMIS